jgi:hypothetical protein
LGGDGTEIGSGIIDNGAEVNLVGASAETMAKVCAELVMVCSLIVIVGGLAIGVAMPLECFVDGDGDDLGLG